MRDLLPVSYDKRAFQKGGVRLEDNEILSEKGMQDRPIVNRSGTVPEPFPNGSNTPIVERCKCCGKEVPNPDHHNVMGRWTCHPYENVR